MIFNLVSLHIEDNRNGEKGNVYVVVNSFQFSIFAH